MRPRCRRARRAGPSGGSDALKTFCETKKSGPETAAKEDEETWGFLGILFEEDARRELLKHLDFGDALVAKELAATEAEAEKARSAAEAEAAAADAAAPRPPVDGDEFFNNLPGADAAAPTRLRPPPARGRRDGLLSTTWTRTAGCPSPPPRPRPPRPPEPIAEAPEVAAAARRRRPGRPRWRPLPPSPSNTWTRTTPRCSARSSSATTAARSTRASPPGVTPTLSCSRSAGGAELWEEARSKHIAANIGRPYMRVASAVVSEDLEALVKSRPLAKWRETLAILCTYAPAESGARSRAFSPVVSPTLATFTRRPCATSAPGTSTPRCSTGSAPCPREGCPARASLRAREGCGAHPRHRAVERRRPGAAGGVLRGGSGVAGPADVGHLLPGHGPDGGDAIVTLRDRIVRGGAGTTASSAAAPPQPPQRPAPAPLSARIRRRIARLLRPAAQPTHPTGTYDGYAHLPRTTAATPSSQRSTDLRAYGQSTHAPRRRRCPRAGAERLRRVHSSPVQSAYGTRPVGHGRRRAGAAGMGAPPPSFSPAAVAAPAPSSGYGAQRDGPERAAAARGRRLRPRHRRRPRLPRRRPSTLRVDPAAPAARHCGPAAYAPAPPAAARNLRTTRRPRSTRRLPGGDYGAYGERPRGDTAHGAATGGRLRARRRRRSSSPRCNPA